MKFEEYEAILGAGEVELPMKYSAKYQEPKGSEQPALVGQVEHEAEELQSSFVITRISANPSRVCPFFYFFLRKIIFFFFYKFFY